MQSGSMLSLCWFVLLLFAGTGGSILYPRDSNSRESKSLDGIWKFRTSEIQDQDAGFREQWYKNRIDKNGWSIPMPVPSSFNDITQQREIRDFIGWAWYEHVFNAPRSWESGHRIVLRFGSVHYYAQVYLNGENVVNHTGGHLPFEVEVTDKLSFTHLNLLTVAVNNTLTSETIPQGSVTFMNDKTRFPENFYEYTGNFDFFNYAGIHRSVILYTTPTTYISDITITTDIINNKTGVVNYSIQIAGKNSGNATCMFTIIDAKGNGRGPGSDTACQGTYEVRNAKLWWPVTMSSNPGYLYKFGVQIQTQDSFDHYYQPFGFRTVKVDGNSFLINGKPFYFMGFGKHEDSNIRGRGLDLPLIIKDFNLIRWIGANCFRTSHYPYAEEIMDQADAQGIVVINESPAVGLNLFNNVLLKHHKNVMVEMINRDKNRPSVVMWSVANEPSSTMKSAADYFRQVVNHTRTLDPSRPVSAALNTDPTVDQAGQFMDVIMMNRYFAWYGDTGYLDVIQKQVVTDFTQTHQKYQKPVLISEYGADTVPGYHMSPSFVFTEDYQTELMLQYHRGFDQLKEQGFFIGEMIWNFADFMTDQQITRVVGNKKGIFTRERQPKAAAKLLRCRYLSLANATLPDDAMYCPAPRSAKRGVWCN